MPRKCCVTNCSSYKLENVSLHSFPANVELNLKWKEALINHTEMEHGNMHHDYAAHVMPQKPDNGQGPSGYTKDYGYYGGHSSHNNHSSHDNHNNHGSNSSQHMMSMAFHFGIHETVLFKNWRIRTVGGLVCSMIGIFLMGALYEGLKYYREYLFWKAYNALQYRAVRSTAKLSNVDDDDEEQVLRPTICSKMHIYQTFLHMVQITVSYMLMLIFMTFNVWLCIAVVSGAALGYFLFGWKKSVVVDVTEHCH